MILNFMTRPSPVHRHVLKLIYQRSRNAAHLSKIDTNNAASCRTSHNSIKRESDMPEVTIIYWRDMPAQVIVGRGRKGSKRLLAERFEQAIDRAAMKGGMDGTDDYLSEWRKSDPVTIEGDPDEIAEAEAQRIEAEYDQERLKALIANDGWD
jgi:hypothetical protein